MRFGSRANRLLIVPLLSLSALLVVVATLQYRWLEQMREATRASQHGAFEFAVRRTSEDLGADLRALFRAFLAPERDDVALRRDHWRRTAKHPDLAGAIYIVEREGEVWSLSRLDADATEPVPAAWPPSLSPLQPLADTLTERGPEEIHPGPFDGTIPALFIVQLPARLEPEFLFGLPRRVIIIPLERGALETILRERVDANFPFTRPSGVDAALLSDGAVIARTTQGWPDGRRPPDVSHELQPVRASQPHPRPPGFAEPSALPREQLRLVVRQRDAGLEAIVDAAHRRNLAIAALVLLVLAASGAFLGALLQRGERLRAQQAQFVAAMSHELNTPLAILRIASENLHDGITDDPEKVSRYVRTIARETANLSEMVNDVLELAGMNAGVSTSGEETVDVGAVVEDAVMRSRLAGRGDDIEVEVTIERDLPPLRGNAQTLARAVQNLVTNAMRHGASGKWVGVRAQYAGGRVRISVEDRGEGIDASDAAHVFEPFYRGGRSGAIRGTGLGLSIVGQVAIDHGGTVSIEPRRGGGAVFVIELPPAGGTDA